MSTRKSQKWPNTMSVLKKAYGTKAGHVKIPITQVPASFDIIKENCGMLAEWWNNAEAARLNNDSFSDCNGIEDQNEKYECIINKLKTIAKDIKIQSIGAGQYGSTFIACKDGECEYILKLQKADDSFMREAYALYDLNNWEYSPIFYGAWTCSGVGFLVTEKMFPLSDCVISMSNAFIKTQLETIIDDLHKKNWMHLDIKPDNVMCKNGHLALIDFGLAVKMDSHNLKGNHTQDLYTLKNYPSVLPDTAKKVHDGLSKGELIRVDLEFTKTAIERIIDFKKQLLKKKLRTVFKSIKMQKSAVNSFKKGKGKGKTKSRKNSNNL